MRVVQLQHPVERRRIALVEEPGLRLLRTHSSVVEAANHALLAGRSLKETLGDDLSDTVLDYDEVYFRRSEWSLLPAADHPTEQARCMVSGTGLTHKKSAANRDAMHQNTGQVVAPITDSMKMYQWGAEGGRPEPGVIGVQPEWFYKGNGAILRAHDEALEVPEFAEDGGEEPEVAGVYLIGTDGQPYRLGFVTGNEFSDHQMERRNYLYLAPSKIRTCAIGPELVLDETFADVRGTVKIERDGATVWSHDIGTGEANMVHSLANLEHHHFKYPLHRRPGDLHVHFFGADAFSFGEGIVLTDGVQMIVHWESLGRPLRNTVRISASPPALRSVRTL